MGVEEVKAEALRFGVVIGSSLGHIWGIIESFVLRRSQLLRF